MLTTGLYILTVAIWGTTWYAIALQTGNVPVLISVFYRFAIASILLTGLLKISKKLHPISKRDHLFCALQGMCVFCFNFLCFYAANHYINSGLESVLFSMAILFNAVNGIVFLGQKLTTRLVIASLLGITGIVSLFWPDLVTHQMNTDTLTGIGLCLLGTYGFSLGNIISARHQKHGIDVLSSNAYAMLYGTATLLLLAAITQTPFSIDVRAPYLGALCYLAIFGSVIAFGAYFTLIGRIGTGGAAYTTLLFPLVALSVSTLFEGYVWTGSAISGLLLILSGNAVMFYQRKIPRRRGVRQAV